MDRFSVAVVEDDQEFREEVLLPVLARAGFDVTGMGSALELYRALVARPFDLVLLDVGLPDDDGYSIATHLRSLSPLIGIVMLTGLGSGEDRVRGLQAGADAYLHKPVDLQELVATLRNLGTRIHKQDGGAAHAGDRKEASATDGAAPGWRLCDSGWRLHTPSGDEVALNLAERQVMTLLAETPGIPVSRAALIERLAGDAGEFDPHRLDMLVYRLRRKCVDQTGVELPLKSVRGVGYVLTWG
ncbi:MAG TPA: response regulator transcription factor [Luteimonas sp.]|nr:response regulator transcription factor [Luteimonas sp.]